MTIWHPDDFATWSNVQNMARQGAVLGVVAIGQMFALLASTRSAWPPWSMGP
jgi:ribose/xylose/arabinose/galactoside ABC-type transport system permease subunit